MTEQVLIVVQARLGSHRLPGKALADVAGVPLLARCLDRMRLSNTGHVVLATTTRDEDDALADLATERGIAVVRGPEQDVLGRFVLAAGTVDATLIVRATADNPAVDIDAPRRVLDALRSAGADHAVESGLPYGTCVEAMTTRALLRSAELATLAHDREHVTTFMRRDPRFLAVSRPGPDLLTFPHLRFTVDTGEDLDYMRAVIGRRPGVETPLRDVIDAARALPVHPLELAS